MSILNVGTVNSTNAVKLASYNNSNLPAGEIGMIIYNTDEETVQLYNGTEWLNIGEKSFAATGGTLLTPGNGYAYHVFTTPGVLEVGGDGTFDILVVGGGGGGGSYYGGGGGGGGVAVATNMPVASGSYPIVIGDGGAQSGNGPVKGNDGLDSKFGTQSQQAYILARGGGAGGGHYTTNPAASGNTGGSGGGSSGNDPNPANGTASQPGTNLSPCVTDYVNPGGYSTPTGGYAPAGGGGAGNAGVSIGGNIPGGGNGGDGVQVSGFEYNLVGLGPLPDANSPSGNQYGGGGGAGLYSTGVAPDRVGLGGAGGGGSGTSSPRGQSAGIDGTGGGGGGRHPSSGQGSAGGKGIVVVRYIA